MSYNFINVFDKINENERTNYKLLIDKIYKANPKEKNVKADVIYKLFPVGNAGGFRILGKQDEPKLIILFTTGEDPYWKDELDEELGQFMYYGDNQSPGKGLHETKLGGNKALKTIFDCAASNDFEQRLKIPPIFVFKKHSGRDLRFLGLATPGVKTKPEKEWLTAVWASKNNGGRFQNYMAYFTLLDTSKGSMISTGPGINLGWITDVVNGLAYQSDYAPKAWKAFIKSHKITPLTAKKITIYSSKSDQLPSSKQELDLLGYIQNYYLTKDRGYSFEKFAIELTKRMNSSVIEISNTRPYKDGGFDGVGKYRIFDVVENSVFVEFYIEAKCYHMDNSVGIRETARLISRIKNRQFGIIFTTSYIAKQAFDEIIEDGHPVVIINGKDIINHLVQTENVKDISDLIEWLKMNQVD